MHLSAWFRRYLSGLSSNNPIKGIPNSEPQKSTLLSRLPLEIRLQIWEEVIGNDLLHMVARRSQPHTSTLKCFPCRAFYTCTTPHKNRIPSGGDAYPRCQGSQQEPCFFSGPVDTPFSASSLLLTCRQTYNEAFDVLYTDNTFNVDNLETLQLMIQVMGSRISSIQAVHVSTAMWKIHFSELTRLSDAAFEEWKKFWHLIAESMSGLQHLRLDIYGTSRAGLEKGDLEPLLQLRGLRSFDLALWQDTNDQDLPGQGSTIVGPMQSTIRNHVCEGRSS